MLCEIADLIVNIPEAGGMAPRCRAYLTNSQKPVDIEIRADEYEPFDIYGGSEAVMAYMESGWQFYMHLLRFSGLMLHASALSYEGKAYLFSGPSGVGKSTHTELWQKCFGDKVQIINDDKPAIRFVDGRWYVYGTPWCGKSGINLNCKVPLGGICFLKRGEKNEIRRLSAPEIVPLLYMQTNHLLKKEENMLRLLSSIESLTQQIPIFELQNRPESAAALLSKERMEQAAIAAGL